VIKNQLPDDVLEQIQDHLREESLEGEKGWDAGEDEEDTLTGDYLGSLRTSDWRVVKTRRVTWKWKITYKKFGSKAGEAPEKHLGADGIVQVELYDISNMAYYYKGMLFQAKKKNAWPARSQATQMESFSRGCSAVFVYGPDQYTDISSDKLLSAKGPEVIKRESVRLGDFLADEFMPCSVGIQGLHYDRTSKSLLVPKRTAGVMRVKREIKHRLQIRIRAIEVLAELED
jgi:hypothetical protein